MEVIGISAKLGSGKDYIYKTYLKPLGYYRWSLADHFKVWLVAKGEATYEEVFITKPPHIRDLLQKEGTERGRDIYGTDIWVATTFTWMRLLNETCGIDKFVIADVRFKNETLAIQKYGGKVYRVIAPKREAMENPTEEARNHISERDLDDFPIESFNGIIFNDLEYSHTVGMQLRTLLGGSPIDVPPKLIRPPLRTIQEGEILEHYPESDEIPLLEKLTDQFEKVGDSLEKVYNIVIGRKSV